MEEDSQELFSPYQHSGGNGRCPLNAHWENGWTGEQGLGGDREPTERQDTGGSGPSLPQDSRMWSWEGVAETEDRGQAGVLKGGDRTGEQWL